MLLGAGYLNVQNSIFGSSLGHLNCEILDQNVFTSLSGNIDSGDSCNFNEQAGDMINKDPLLTFFRREFWLLAFFLGVAFMVNSWDVVTLGILAAVTLLGNQLLIAAKGDGENYKLRNLGKNIYKKCIGNKCHKHKSGNKSP